MRTRFWSLPLFLSLVMIFSGYAQAADAQTEKEIQETLKKYSEAYEKRDIKAIMSFFSTDPGVILIDGISEFPIVGADQIKMTYERDFSQIQASRIEYTKTYVGGKGDTAWFTTSLIGHIKVENQESPIPALWSGVMQKTGGKWLIVQSHFSYVPIVEFEEGPAPAPETPAQKK